MKSIIKWLILAALLVGILVLAGSLYRRLSTEYAGNQLMPPPQTGQIPANDGSNPDTPADTGETKNDTSAESTPADGTAPPDKSALTAPDFTALDWEGNEVSLSDYFGKPIVLNFWATWCYYCTVEMPDFEIAREKYPDVQFLMVNATDGVRETVELAKRYIEEGEYGFDVLFDTELSAVNAYYVTGFPTTFFLDPDGTLITYASGMLNLPTLEKGIGMILPGE